MRTTLTLDADVAARLAAEMRRTGTGMKATVNQALRRGLGLAGNRPAAPRFRVKAHAFGFKPGVDLNKLNQLYDEVETQSAAEKLKRDHS